MDAHTLGAMGLLWDATTGLLDAIAGVIDSVRNEEAIKEETKCPENTATDP